MEQSQWGSSNPISVLGRRERGGLRTPGGEELVDSQAVSEDFYRRCLHITPGRPAILLGIWDWDSSGVIHTDRPIRHLQHTRVLTDLPAYGQSKAVLRSSIMCIGQYLGDINGGSLADIQGTCHYELWTHLARFQITVDPFGERASSSLQVP